LLLVLHRAQWQPVARDRTPRRGRRDQAGDRPRIRLRSASGSARLSREGPRARQGRAEGEVGDRARPGAVAWGGLSLPARRIAQDDVVDTTSPQSNDPSTAGPFAGLPDAVIFPFDFTRADIPANSENPGTSERAF